MFTEHETRLQFCGFIIRTLWKARLVINSHTYTERHAHTEVNTYRGTQRHTLLQYHSVSLLESHMHSQRHTGSQLDLSVCLTVLMWCVCLSVVIWCVCVSVVCLCVCVSVSEFTVWCVCVCVVCLHLCGVSGSEPSGLLLSTMDHMSLRGARRNV